jgi:hypothetical protein
VPAVVLAADKAMYEKYERIGAKQAESSRVRWKMAEAEEEIARLEEQVDDENRGAQAKVDLKAATQEKKRLQGLQNDATSGVQQVYKECIIEYGSDWLHRSSIEAGVRWIPLLNRRETARAAAIADAGAGAGPGAVAVAAAAAAAVTDPTMLDLTQLLRELEGHGVGPS